MFFMAVFAVFLAESAQARSNLIDQALNQSLQERAEVHKTFKDSKAASRAEERANAQAALPISIEMGDEIGSGGSDRASARIEREEKMEREDISNFDRELRDADRNLGDARGLDKFGR